MGFVGSESPQFLPLCGCPQICDADMPSPWCADRANQCLNMRSPGALLELRNRHRRLLSKPTPLFVLLKEPAFLRQHTPQVVSGWAGYSRAKNQLQA
jgi:hypothetical protein